MVVYVYKLLLACWIKKKKKKEKREKREKEEKRKKDKHNREKSKKWELLFTGGGTDWRKQAIRIYSMHAVDISHRLI